MADPIISLKNVTKRYGNARGITNISLDIQPGEVFGFLGPNGAGKSTTINMLIDLTRPTSGKISIFGQDSVEDSLQIRQNVGFLTGDMALDLSLTGLQQLTYFANLRGEVPLKRIKELAAELDLNLHRKIKTLSRGNRQKIGLISALMHDPDLLILDEPTTGLDPLVQADFNKIVLDNKKRGKTTFLSSHLLSEVQEICDHVAFIREGKIIGVQIMADIASGSPKGISLTSSDQALKQDLKKLKGVKIISSTRSQTDLSFTGDINELLRLIAKHKVSDITIKDADLETIFMQYYQEAANV